MVGRTRIVVKQTHDLENVLFLFLSDMSNVKIKSVFSYSYPGKGTCIKTFSLAMECSANTFIEAPYYKVTVYSYTRALFRKYPATHYEKSRHLLKKIQETLCIGQ